MTPQARLFLTIFFATTTAGVSWAGSGDIRQRQDQASIELSNVGDDDAPVVVAAPPAPKRELAAPSVATGVKSATVQERAATSSSRTRMANKEAAKHEDDVEGNETPATTEATLAVENVRSAGPVQAVQPDWAVRQPYAPSVSGGASASGSAGSSFGDGSTSGSGNLAGDSQAGTVGFGSGTVQTPTSVIDSPDLLAARIAQYRDMMLTEPRGANGLVSNPAVQRRYLMMNRTTYMNQRW